MDEKVIQELRELASGMPDFESIELPDVEQKLWLGQQSHPEWRVANMPHVTPELVPHAKCEACGQRLHGLRVISWMSPHPAYRSMWETHALHIACAGVPDAL